MAEPQYIYADEEQKRHISEARAFVHRLPPGTKAAQLLSALSDDLEYERREHKTCDEDRRDMINALLTIRESTTDVGLLEIVRRVLLLVAVAKTMGRDRYTIVEIRDWYNGDENAEDTIRDAIRDRIREGCLS